MIQVTFYTFKKRENSTLRPSGLEQQNTYNVSMKDDCSMIAPVLMMDFGMRGNPSFYNYCYISNLGGRYYFIRNWTYTGGRWLATCEVDVLASFRPDIGASRQYVLRAAADSNGAIMDQLYPLKASATFAKTTTEIWPQANLTGGSYVVGIINRSPDAVGAVAYYVFTPTQFREFCEFLLGDISWTGGITEISEDLLKTLINPFQYVVSCIWFADGAPAGAAVEEIPFGWWSVTTPAKKLKTTGVAPSSIVLKIPKHPDAASRGSYLNLSPNSEYVLDSRVWGTINLDTTSLIGATNLFMDYRIDFVTGISDMELKTDKSGDSVIERRRGMYGVPIQLAQIGNNVIGFAAGAASTVARVGANIMSGNITGAISSGLTGVGNAASSLIPQGNSNGSNGSLVNFAAAPSLSAKFLRPVEESNEHRGRPLCEEREVLTLHGYQLIADADIKITGTLQEAQRIKEYMESGFYFE